MGEMKRRLGGAYLNEGAGRLAADAVDLTVDDGDDFSQWQADCRQAGQVETHASSGPANISLQIRPATEPPPQKKLCFKP